jgi:ATP-dependent DNA helicase RecG
LRINFRALESALIDQPKVPKDQNDTLADKLIEAIKCDPKIKQDKLAEKFKVSVPAIKRAMKLLSDGGKIERKGGKRLGYWVVK